MTEVVCFYIGVLILLVTTAFFLTVFTVRSLRDTAERRKRWKKAVEVMEKEEKR